MHLYKESNGKDMSPDWISEMHFHLLGLYFNLYISFYEFTSVSSMQDFQDSRMSSLMSFLTSVPRAAQLLHKEPAQILLVNSLEHEFKHYLQNVHRHTFRQDKRWNMQQSFWFTHWLSSNITISQLMLFLDAGTLMSHSLIKWTNQLWCTGKHLCNH